MFLVSERQIATDNMSPFVSVIMPAYNARPYIGEAIRSVLDQDYPNLELIVVDDGSSDGTADEARLFGERVRVYERTNGGPAAARNFGLSVAQGELIAFLDADDIWLPGKLAAQVSHLQAHPEIGMVFSRFLFWYPEPNGKFAPPRIPKMGAAASEIVHEHSGWIYCPLLYDSIVTIISVLIRRSVIETVGGFNEQLRTGEDYDYWLRVSRIVQATKLSKNFACYRIHPQSTTHVSRMVCNEYQVLKKNLQKYGLTGPDGSQASSVRIKDRLYRICFNHAYLHYWNGDASTSRKAFADAISHVGYRPKAWLYWILALARELFGIRPNRQF